GLSGQVDLDAYRRKVLKAFTDIEGRITAFPAQEKKFLVLLRHVLQDFEFDKRYTEKQVNEILSNHNEDTALLRRSLVEYHFMARQGGGGEYGRRFFYAFPLGRAFRYNGTNPQEHSPSNST
ncbi:DUF2087 domain-containing protein, partial [bacterium]|nr:DUF2087 domain-containing protein [bacterium]